MLLTGCADSLIDISPAALHYANKCNLLVLTKLARNAGRDQLSSELRHNENSWLSRGLRTCERRSEDMWRRYCRLTSFFPIVDKCHTCEDIAR